MATDVTGVPGFDVDLALLKAIGGPGNAVFWITDATSDASLLIDACTELSWKPLVIRTSDQQHDHINFPHESEVGIPLESVPDFLSTRFKSGLPVHFLDAAGNEPVGVGMTQRVISAGIRPWIIRADSNSPVPPNYVEVGTSDGSVWLLAEEHSHLKGSLAAAVQPALNSDARVSKLASAKRRIKAFAKARLTYLPKPVRNRVEQQRHLRHVVAQQAHLTDPAFLGQGVDQPLQWIDPVGLPDLPPAGVELHPLSDEDVDAVLGWLDNTTIDTDDLLERRVDNQGDELGRTVAALRTRLALRNKQASGLHEAPLGPKVLFDARSLQSTNFSGRGIGRFAAAALTATREAVPPEDLVLLVDPRLDPLPDDLVEACTLVTAVAPESVADYSVLVQPSPMTAAVDPLVPLLHSSVHKVAIVFDFIPMHYPSIYLRHPAARTEYAAALDALFRYDEFVCISDVTAHELMSLMEHNARDTDNVKVLTSWPNSIQLTNSQRPLNADAANGPIIVTTGDEPRKNTFGALAAIGVATAGSTRARDVRVIGLAGQESRVHHWAISAALRDGETHTVERLSDEDMHTLVASASLMVVASFEEGLSLPVLEAVNLGVPVVASDIPAHRELIGAGSHLAPVADLGAFAYAIRRHRGRRRTFDQQRRALAAHKHRSLEQTISEAVTGNRRSAPPHQNSRATRARPERLSIAFATPWHPQPTGVADFSVATVQALAELADVTIYTTADAAVSEAIPHAPVSDLLYGEPDHDVVVAVVGNSHFHLPFIELLNRRSCVAVAHDVRMVEFYMALRSKGGAEQLMLRGTGKTSLTPSLDEQIQDMRLLQNAGMWEVARQSSRLITHSSMAADRIAKETGVAPHVLPFANQRVPDTQDVTDSLRRDARHRLGLRDDVINLATFGYVDIRTKQTDVVVETAAWLHQWGHRVALHIVGAANAHDERVLTRRAQMAGIDDFRITGFVDETTFRDYLLGIDVGRQLRISPLLGVSGPLSDLAAFGTSAVASRGLAIDVDTPDYITRLPDDVSPMLVAEAIEEVLNRPSAAQEREAARQEYLVRHSPQRYARLLLDVLEASMPS